MGEAEEQSYVNNFMNKILINPLSEIMRLSSSGQKFESMICMQSYIPALPPKIREDFDPYLTKLDGFFKSYYGIVGRTYPNVQALRVNYFRRYGLPLHDEVYRTLFPLLYSTRLFEALRGTPYEIITQGPTKFGVRN